jgi:hypothetical protein
LLKEGQRLHQSSHFGVSSCQKAVGRFADAQHALLRIRFHRQNMLLEGKNLPYYPTGLFPTVNGCSFLAIQGCR